MEHMRKDLEARILLYWERLKAGHHFAAQRTRVPKLEFHRGNLKAGLAYYSRNLISLHEDFLAHNATREDMLEDTLPHELAHVWAFQLFGDSGIGHGPLWKNVFVALTGKQASRCHNYDVSIARPNAVNMEFICGCAGRKWNLSAMMQNQAAQGLRHCKTCKQTLKLNVEDSI